MSQKQEKGWLIFLILVSLALRWAVSYKAKIYFDGCGYIMHAWSIAQGKLTTPYWMSGIDHYYPPLYPFLIYLFHFLFPSWADAAKGVSVVLGSFLILPVYFLARRLFSREIALLSSALLVSFPILVKTGGNTYSEPVFLFFLVLSMLYGWKMLFEKKSRFAFLAGFWLGVAYLARTQAVVGLASLVLALGWFWLVGKKLSFRGFAKFLALSLVGFYLFAFPYDFYSYKKNGIWGLRFRMEFFKKGYQYKELEWYIQERILNKEASELLVFELARTHSPFAFIIKHPKTYFSWVKNDFVQMLVREFKENRLTPRLISISILFLLLGMVFSKDARRFAQNTYLFLWFIPLIIVVPLTVTGFDRYFIALTIPLVLWAAQGIELLRFLLPRLSWNLEERRISFPAFISYPGIWMILVILLYPKSELQELLLFKEHYPKEEAQWLREMVGGNKVIMSPEPYAPLYSGNYWYMLPIDNAYRVSRYARAQKVDFVLIDDGFLSWLEAPIDFKDQYFSPQLAKAGLKFLGEQTFEIKKPLLVTYRKEAVYQVGPAYITPPAFPQLPNIILISIDTLRADHLSCYGYQRKTSPNLDRIASEGVRFERVISQAPKTAPSHMTMFTSLYPSLHGVHRDYDQDIFFQLSPIWQTLTEILKKAGYRTAAFTGGGQVSAGFGFERGFEIYQENMYWLEWEDFLPVLDWLNQLKDNEPFFLFLHTYEVHDPYCPPEPYNKLYDPDYQGWILSDYQELKKRTGKDRRSVHNLFWGGKEKGVKGDRLNLELISERDTQHFLALYDGEIRYTDEILGRFFKELEKRGLLGNDRTLLIITSDHGEEFREHGDFLHKRLYWETMEVPLIFYCPGIIPPGKVIKGQARLIDLAPTILDLIGIPIPEQMQGVSLKDIILSGSYIKLNAYSEDHFIKHQYGIRDNGVFFYLKGDEQILELYFTDLDPKEKFNLLASNKILKGVNIEFIKLISEVYHKKKVKYYHFYNEMHKKVFEVEEAKTTKITPEQLKQLRALGYIK